MYPRNNKFTTISDLMNKVYQFSDTDKWEKYDYPEFMQHKGTLFCLMRKFWDGLCSIAFTISSPWDEAKALMYKLPSKSNTERYVPQIATVIFGFIFMIVGAVVFALFLLHPARSYEPVFALLTIIGFILAVFGGWLVFARPLISGYPGIIIRPRLCEYSRDALCIRHDKTQKKVYHLNGDLAKQYYYITSSLHSLFFNCGIIANRKYTYYTPDEINAIHHLIDTISYGHVNLHELYAEAQCIINQIALNDSSEKQLTPVFNCYREKIDDIKKIIKIWCSPYGLATNGYMLLSLPNYYFFQVQEQLAELGYLGERLGIKDMIDLHFDGGVPIEDIIL